MSSDRIDTGIKVFNTLGAGMTPLTKQRNEPLRVYTCGPTVYAKSHLGHARTYISLDMIRRIITDYFNIPTQWSMNITDIDDKIIDSYNQPDNKKKFGTISQFSSYCEENFFVELDTLNIRRPDVILRVTEVIPEIIQFIKELIDRGFAYASEGSVYFDVDTYEKDGRFVYAELERQSYESTKMHEGVNPVTGVKRNRNDFVLWKAAKEGEPYWESPWGRGRPGWHIECSTMSRLMYGDQFDVHCGGIDLRFPHHTNEIAQSQAVCGCTPWVYSWLHTGQLQINGEKMAKSAGNFRTIESFLELYNPQFTRFIFASTHWQNVMELKDDIIERTRGMMNRFSNFLQMCETLQKTSISKLKRGISDADKDFISQLEEAKANIDSHFRNNFDIPSAFQELTNVIDSVYQKQGKILDTAILSAGRLVKRILSVLGFTPETMLLSETSSFNVAPLGQAFADHRVQLRMNNSEMLKTVRDLCKELGIDLKKQSNDEKNKSKFELLSKLEAGVKRSMTLADTIRDDILPDYGIKLEDSGNGTLFKISDPEELKELKKQRDLKNSFNNEQGHTAPKKKQKDPPLPPSDYFRQKTSKFSEWDDNGFPTKTADGKALGDNQIKNVNKEWKEVEITYNTWLKYKQDPKKELDDPKDYFRKQTDKYSEFQGDVPSKFSDGSEIPKDEVKSLWQELDRVKLEYKAWKGFKKDFPM